MNLKHLTMISVLVTATSFSAVVLSEENTQTMPMGMPDMSQLYDQAPMGYAPGTMSPMQQQQMMRMRQQNGGMQPMGTQGQQGMPMGMMNGSQGGMPMMNMMGGNTTGPGSMGMMSRDDSGMPMMNMMGKQGGMPMMDMMKERHTEMKTHMGTMETRLANIENLLRQLVDLQKKR